MRAMEVTAFLAAALLTGVTASEVASVRSYFYVGGNYVDNGKGEHIFRDQMYVEKLCPVEGVTQETPVVIIHGQGQTGTNFLNKPDGGRGWVSEFLLQGYEVYVVDQTLRARSAWDPRSSQKVQTISAESIQQRFTAAKKFALWPQAINHTQWPGKGVIGDEIFDAFYSSNVQFIDDAVYQQSTMQKAGAALLEKIGKPSILIGHSQGGVMPVIIADARPELAKGLVLIEPQGPPFRDAVFDNTSARAWGLTDIPLNYEPKVHVASELHKQVYPADGELRVDCVLQAAEPLPRQLVNIKDKPILILTGEASYHSQYDYCTAKYLKQAGCHNTHHAELGTLGIHGNGHMMFMEKNSQQIQQLLHRWIQG